MAAQKWHSKGTGKNWKCVHEHGRGSGAAPASVCAALRVLTDAQNATKTDIKKERCSVPPCFRLWLPVVILPGGPANKAKNSTKKAAKLPQNATRKRLKRRKKSDKKRLRKFRKVCTKKDAPWPSPQNPEKWLHGAKNRAQSAEKCAQKKTPARGRGGGHLVAALGRGLCLPVAKL